MCDKIKKSNFVRVAQQTINLNNLENVDNVERDYKTNRKKSTTLNQLFKVTEAYKQTDS